MKLRPAKQKARRGRRCGRLLETVEQQLGGGVLLFLAKALGRRIRALTSRNDMGGGMSGRQGREYPNCAQIIGRFQQA
jgi:hypothetical protein